MSAPNPTPAASKKKKAKKQARGGGSNVFDQFSQKQVAEFKEGFQFMDRDNAGLIDCDSIKTAVINFGERYTKQEVDQFFKIVPVEDKKFPAKYCSDMLTGKLKEEDAKEED